MTKENILIFGDSYSTYEGHIPEGYPAYYPNKEDKWNVCDVSHTWWKMLADEENYNVVMNNSWSGSTMCNTGYEGDCSATSSFIHRLDELIENGFFTKNIIDRVFVFGGTNDSWIGTKCGDDEAFITTACGRLKFADWTETDLQLILPGICCFVDKLQKAISNEKIHIIINTELRNEVEKGFMDICNYYNINYTLLKNIEKIGGHPTFQGMIEIKNQIQNNLKLIT